MFEQEAAVRAAESISHAALMVQHTIQNMVSELDSPFVRLRPKIFPDGDKWCALYGDDLQMGVAGFGDTPQAAQWDFDKNWRTQLAIDESANREHP